MAVPSVKLSNGSEMPMIGLGTWNSTDPIELEKILNAAFELGYRHIDTAFIYQNEEIIGKVVNKWIKDGKLKREQFFISTKFPMVNVSPEDVSKYLETSLNRLGLDYVDLYLIHFPLLVKIENGKTVPTPAAVHQLQQVQLWQEMEKQVMNGRAKEIGVCNYNKTQIKRLLENKVLLNPSILQIENHVYLQQNDLVEFCQEHGVVVTAFSPLGCPGYNKILEENGFPPKQIPDLLNVESVKKIAGNNNKTNAQILLRYQVQRNITIVSKTLSVERLKENFELFDFKISDEEMKELADLDIGETARICDYKFLGVDENPEFPFEKNYILKIYD